MSQEYDYGDGDYDGYDYDDGSGYMQPENSNQFAAPVAKPKYQTRSEHQTVQRVLELANELGSQIGYEHAEAECLALLSAANFDMYKASQLPFDGSKEAANICNGDNNASSYLVPWGNEQRGHLVANTETAECSACFLELAPNEGRAFCSHFLCRECLQTKLEVHRKEWRQENIVLRCDPSKKPFCLGMTVIPLIEPELTAFLGSSFVDGFMTKHRYQWCGLLSELSHYPTKITLTAEDVNGKSKDFTFQHARFVWCGTEDCGTMFEVERQMFDTDQHESIVGKCGDCSKRTCFICTSKEHSPASCAAMSMWRAKESDEGLTAAWTLVHTKPCSKCHSLIEKNEGCNHMTCRKCKHEFCWICMGDWSSHGTSYYSCNKMKKDDTVLAKDIESARASLQRYTHYYNRYQNHMNSVRLDEKTMQAVNRYVNSNFDGGNITYLEDVAKTLFDCRYTLANTYVYAYFTKHNVDIFEYNQGRLEHATEELSRIVETCKRGGEMANSQLEIQNKASIAKRYLEVLRKGI